MIVVLYPPKTNADVVIPVPPVVDLAVLISVVSVQFVPFHSSVFPVVEAPPKARIAVLPEPDAATGALPVFKSLTSVQLLPFQSSVLVTKGVPGVFPPKAKAEVFVPPPPS